MNLMIKVGFFFHCCQRFLHIYYILHITVSNDGNSTREPSVIEIDAAINASDGEGNKSTDDETPEEELGKY